MVVTAAHHSRIPWSMTIKRGFVDGRGTSLKQWVKVDRANAGRLAGAEGEVPVQSRIIKTLRNSNPCCKRKVYSIALPSRA